MEKSEGKEPILNYRLLKDTVYEFESWPFSRSWVLRAGEVCSYFKYSNTYLFEDRDGVAPYFSRETVEQQKEFFEPVYSIEINQF